MDALHFAPYSEIMDAGRARTVLGCGNPKVSKRHAQPCRRIPTPLRSGCL